MIGSRRVHQTFQRWVRAPPPPIQVRYRMQTRGSEGACAASLRGSGASRVEVRAGICLIHRAVAFWFLITADMRAENILKARGKHGARCAAGQASALWSSSYRMMTPQCNCSLWGIVSLKEKFESRLMSLRLWCAPIN